jgi:superfamily II DNA or RNA helicase
MKLYSHQQKIIDDDPKKCGLFLGTGSGKTLTALSLAQGNTLVITTKTVRDDKTWERNLEKLGKKLHYLEVISKEDLRRDWDKLPLFNTVIFDEIHVCCGISPAFRWKNKKPIPKTSQVFDACLDYLTKKPPARLYLLTATPVRNPLAVFALLVLLGKKTMNDFESFRRTFYILINMNHKEIYMAKKDEASQDKLGKLVQSCGYTGRLSDFADVPEQTHRVVNVPLSKEQVDKLKELPVDFPDPLVLTGKKHQVEQGVLKGNEFEDSQTFPTGKLEAIEDLYEEFGKVLVFCKYTEQIEQIKYHFRDYPVFSITGKTEDRGLIITMAERSPKCILIVQSSISAGWEFPSCRCTIYASMSYSYVDLNQSQGRTLRINNLQKNLYVYLLSGEIDKAVYKALENKGDFQEATYAKVT